MKKNPSPHDPYPARFPFPLMKPLYKTVGNKEMGPQLMKTGNLTPDLVPSIIAGIINGLVCIVSAMALAALIFTGPLSAYLSQGIGILLLGTAIFAILSALTATHPLVFIGIQDIPIAILALIGATVAVQVGEAMTAQQAFEFIVVAIGLTSILVGLFFLLLGHFKLGKLVRFIPFPVVGGFLAGTGWLIVKFSFTMMADMDLSLLNVVPLFEGGVFYRWAPGLVFALVLLIAARRIKHYLLMPGILFGSITLFYTIMFVQGFSYADLVNNGYLLGPFPEGGLFSEPPFAHVPTFRWDLFGVHLPAIATMMVLSTISILFNYSGLEIILKEDFDLDKELRLTGYHNILAGLAGTSPGYMTLSETSMAYNLGARSRIPSIVVALLCILTLLFGAQVLSVFPRVILGGLLLNLGLGFLVEWLVDTWKKLHKSDYFVIVSILIVIGVLGFLQGIVVGLLLSMVLFVINYSKIEVVKDELTGKTFRSNVERSESLNRILEQRGDQVFILSLQGFVFFGTANHLLQRVQARLDAPEGRPLHYLLFDFRQVTGLDSSAINSFKKLLVIAQKNDFQVLLCGLDEDIKNQLALGGLLPDEAGIMHPFADLDHGMEWCERQMIQAARQGSDADTHLEDNNGLCTLIRQMSAYLEDREVLAGTVLIEQGKDPGGIFFLEAGQITVKLNGEAGKQMRLKTMGPGTVVGEISLYLGCKASASVVANVPCQVKYLSKENFQKMNLKAPKKARDLHIFVVKRLSDRLAKSNATLQALLD